MIIGHAVECNVIYKVSIVVGHGVVMLCIWWMNVISHGAVMLCKNGGRLLLAMGLQCFVYRG